VRSFRDLDRCRGLKLCCRVSRRDFLFTCPDNFAAGCIVYSHNAQGHRRSDDIFNVNCCPGPTTRTGSGSTWVSGSNCHNLMGHVD